MPKPETIAWLRHAAAAGDATSLTLLEVLERLERLEAGVSCPHSRSDECALARERPMPVAPSPAGSLVEEVMHAGGIGLLENARAAIRAVAAAARDLDELSIHLVTWEGVARWLEQEAAR